MKIPLFLVDIEIKYRPRGIKEMDVFCRHVGIVGIMLFYCLLHNYLFKKRNYKTKD